MQNTEQGGASAPPREYPMIDALAMEIKRMLRSMEPPAQVRAHFRNARVEVLKGLREVIDSRIERLSRKDQTGQKIDID